MSQKQPTYSIGDQVQLKSGGPCMTVNEAMLHHISEEFLDKYKCQWFSGKKLDIGTFPENSLETYVAPKVDPELKKSSSR